MVWRTPGGSVSCSWAGSYPCAEAASVPPAVPTPSSNASPAAVAAASTRAPLPVHVIVAPATGWFLSALTTRTGRNPSGMATATSRPSDGTWICRTYVELAMCTSTCAGPGGKFVSVTRPSASVTPRHPNEVARLANGNGSGGTLGDAEIRTAFAGPNGDVMRNVARPATTSGVSTVPLPDTATTREVVSSTLAHRSAAVVDTRYCPAANRSNVARPC